MSRAIRILLCAFTLLGLTNPSLARAESKTDTYNRQMDLLWTDLTGGATSHEQAAKAIIADGNDLEYRVAGLISAIAYTRSIATEKELHDVDYHVAALDRALVNEATAFNQQNENSRKALGVSIDMVIMLSSATLGYIGGYRLSNGFSSMHAKSQVLGLGAFFGLVGGITAANLFADKIIDGVIPQIKDKDIDLNLDIKD